MIAVAVYAVLPLVTYGLFESIYNVSDGGENPNDLCHLIKTGQNAIAFGRDLMLVVFAPLLFAYGAIKIMISRGSPEKLGEGKKIVTGTVVGILLGLGAFLIINAFVALIGAQFSNSPTNTWYQFDCTGSIIPKPTPPQASGGSTNPPPQNGNNTHTGDGRVCGDYVAGCKNSPALNTLLGCLGNQVSSFGQPTTSNGNHRTNSCHFGGPNCIDGAHAVDFGGNPGKGNEGTIGPQIINAAQACSSAAGGVSCRCENANGESINCNASDANHVHCNVANSSCGCN